MGTPEFAASCLRALLESRHLVVGVVTQMDRPRGRGKKLAFSPVKELALKQGLPVLQPSNLKDPEFLSILQEWDPEAIVVAAFGRLLPPAVLSLPPYGCINVHASLLPRYRGAAPIQRAIMNGEKETGVTTMYMVEKLDAGDIILQQKVSIPPEMTAGELERELASLGAGLLVRTLDLIEVGQAPRIPQNEELATYAPPLTPEEEKINWAEEAVKIVNHIRGLSPLPGAYTLREGERLKIYRARVWDGEKKDKEILQGRPGQITAIFPQEGFLVQAGEGEVLILEVQPPGKRVMSAAEYLRGYRLKAGEYLG